MRNGLQEMVARYQGDTVTGDNITHYKFNDYPVSKRKLVRYMTNGIVALTSSEEPVITNIYDISPGGVAFLSRNESDVSANELKMDIVIFDSQTDFEYFILQVKGRVRSKELVTAPKSNKPIWRFGVEFLELDCLKQSLLRTFCGMERTTRVCNPSQPLAKIAFQA